jgi:hypothetical protein
MSQPDLSSATDPGLPPPLPMAIPLSEAPQKPKRGAPFKAPRRPRAAAAPADDLPPLADSHDLMEAAPAWLISAIIHMLALMVLGMALVANEAVPQFVLSLSTQDDGGEDFQAGDADLAVDLDQPPLEPGDSLEPLQLHSTDNPEAAATAPAPLAALGLVTQSETPALEMALTGREAGMKESLLRAYGGTSSTESAVTEALRWLARNQQSNSLWSLTGKYSDGASSENQDAATAMALLAFQGAGITPESDRKGPFTTVVAKAWHAFLKRQDKEGNFFQEGSGTGRLYTQALCTIALCELYGMTHESKYRDQAQRAVDYCLKVQAPEGGWRYQPGIDSDTSVTGWFVMALQSARMAGLEVPSPALGRVGDFLDTVSLDGGAQYSYVPNQGKKISMTAEGLLCRQYLGWPHSDERLRRGVDVIVHDLPKIDSGKTHVYYWYYAAQVCHHMEGEPWQKWNSAMREVVPALQIREGKERGSWDPNLDETTGVGGGGRLFVTCLSTYMLEVYYRHLPIYQLELLKGSRQAASLSASPGDESE